MTGGQLVTVALAVTIASVVVSLLFGEHGIPHLLALRTERRAIGEATFGLFQQNARLREQAGRLKTDDLYLEALARRQLGMVRPNEVVYRFRGARVRDDRARDDRPGR